MAFGKGQTAEVAQEGKGNAGAAPSGPLLTSGGGVGWREGSLMRRGYMHTLEKEMASHSCILAWRIQGQRSLVFCCLWGHTELDMTEAT